MHSSCLLSGANVRPNNGAISLASSCKSRPHVEFSRFKEDYYCDSTPANVLAKVIVCVSEECRVYFIWFV